MFADDLSPDQLLLHQKVEKIASTIKDQHGVSYEKVISAISMTESCMGKHLVGDMPLNSTDLTKASLGIMQVRLSTARFVGHSVPEFNYISKLSNVQLASLLLSNPTFNIKVGTSYFILNKNKYGSLYKAISTYNGGLDNYRYVSAVLSNLKLLKSTNQFLIASN